MHIHEWHTQDYFLLRLPTRDGLAERSTIWRCALCPQREGRIGDVPVGMPLYTPEVWATMQAEEDQKQTPEALQARLEAKYRIT